MSGRIAADTVTPSRRVIRVDFTTDEIVAMLKTRAAFVANINVAREGVDVQCKNGMHLGVSVEISFDVPAATPAPFPTIVFPAAPSAPPPAPLFWWEFPVVSKGTDRRIATAWGHGPSEAEAYLDARERHSGDSGMVDSRSLRTMLDLPINVTPLYYEFANGEVSSGCTEHEARRNLRKPYPAVACVRRSRQPIGTLPGSAA